MFAYPDAQRYRLGVNYTQLPPNRPIVPVYAPYERDGITTTDNYKGDPNYLRSTLSPGVLSRARTQIRHLERVPPEALLGLNEMQVTDEDYAQPRILWNKVFDDEEREKWVKTCVGTLEDVPTPLRDAVVQMFGKVDPMISKMMLATIKENAPHL